MKKHLSYNLINNSLGWLCFIVAAVTYLFTLEPTASFWDCPEFISQGAKLEVGHPPGNPIFMLVARFFINFAGGDITKYAICVNAMSALFSAGTILLLFWTITHLVKRLLVADNTQTDIEPWRLIAIMGSGLCGALVYTWSDTFWFSAVEGEVYAFSSFCTALVFWLILKWENRADQPHSDRYLILIAYVIGISIAVHLLNLLCIPAIVLVFYYRKNKNTSARGSLIALGISFVIVALILFGLVPGFIKIAQWFELFFVNTLHASYNVGVMVYVLLFVAVAVWSVKALYEARSAAQIRLSTGLLVVMSGIPFIGDSIWLHLLLIAAVAIWIFTAKHLYVRILSIISLSITVIFVGYSSYALLLIRSSANPAMNQNAPDNVFALGSYLNREQYGEAPLLYGQQFTSIPIYEVDPATYVQTPLTSKGHTLYGKVVKSSADQRDEYVATGQKETYNWTPNTIFPRMYSRSGNHPAAYLDWIGASQDDLEPVTVQPFRNPDGSTLEYMGKPFETTVKTPTMLQNLQYFVTYQLTHMYWRYFMWNFAGRQNDLQGNGEVNRGNWISGIPFIDNARLGDQSLLPAEQGAGNRGHNVFYMLPLLLGVIGLLWQAFVSKRGIEQFWVVFFLFFMTGIAIVLYLNQPPTQPRERDYAFAGSFYAYSIWVGIAVAAIASWLSTRLKAANGIVAASLATLVGLAVPLQMVSQTWDDHDRSGRFAARDFGMNYLSSLAPNAIIFTNGDNDTFPLWYAQEVEQFRPDVRVVNLSYLTTDWYANQMKMPTDSAMGIDMLATPEAYAYDRLQYNYFTDDSVAARTPVDALQSLGQLYSQAPESASKTSVWQYPDMYVPSNVAGAVKSGIISANEASAAHPFIPVNLAATDRGATLSTVLSLDMLATSAKNGWNRPIYFAMTVPDSYYLNLSPFMRSTGLAYQVTPIQAGDKYGPGVDTDRSYQNIMTKFKWAGIPEAIAKGKPLYIDETIGRMITTHRSTMLDLATALYNEAVDALEAEYDEDADSAAIAAFAKKRFGMALDVVNLMQEKLPREAHPYGIQIGEQIGMLYQKLGTELGDSSLIDTGNEIIRGEIINYADYARYIRSLGQGSWKYNTLSRSDKYVPTYLLRLIQAYYAGGGDIDAITGELEARGLDASSIGE